MGVRRSELPHAHYTVVRNAWARDRRVTLKAKGLLTYLLSHQVGYDVTQAQIIRDTDDGRASVVSGLEELERAGYLTRTRQRSESGRFAEYDYELADPFDPAGTLLPASAENPNRRGGNRPENPTSAENPHGAPVQVSPPGETAPIEEHSKRTPVPTGQGERRLTAVPEPEGPTVNQRARQLAQEHYDAVEGMCAFMGVRNVVVAGLQRLGLDDDQARAVLARLREGSRPVTLQTFREAARGLPSGRAAPYRDPTDPTAYHQPL